MSRFRNWLRCLVGLHDLRVIGQPTEWSLHLGCKHCSREFGFTKATEMVHGRSFILPWKAVRDYYAERGYRP